MIALLATVWLAFWTTGAQAQEEEFPAGEGRDIWETSCTGCHGAEEVVKLKGLLETEGWQTVIKSMTDYGAQIDPEDVPVLVEYLNRNFGKQP